MASPNRSGASATAAACQPSDTSPFVEPGSHIRAARLDVDRCDCKGGVRDQAQTARLIVDGTPFTVSADESSTPIMTTSTFSDVMLVFDIPADASDAVLQVGPLEEPDQQATFDLALD